MILVMDIGNTHIDLGAYDGEKLCFRARMATESARTEDQDAVELDSILRMHGCRDSRYTVAALSCVVPPLLPVMRKALAMLLGCRVMAVGPGVKTGLNIRIENPAILGADIVCSAVAAIKKYPLPCILIDMGTATKISAIDEKGTYLGCSIMPGVGISLDALSARTAQLPHIDMSIADDIIGVNSVESMRSGIVYGNASMLDGMIKRFRAVLGQNASVVATGGYAGNIIGHCENKIDFDENLILEGLLAICIKNEK